MSSLIKEKLTQGTHACMICATIQTNIYICPWSDDVKYIVEAYISTEYILDTNGGAM